MFGANPIRSKSTDGDNLSVEASFYTIQGEGPFTGCPATFIRMAGCNLACYFCDTQFETMADFTQTLTDYLNSLYHKTTPVQRRLVVLTGGEPLRQNVVPLIKALLSSGTEIVQIETAGTLWQEGMTELVQSGRVVIVCSPKTAGVNAAMAEFCFHWKYVIKAGETSPEDGLPIKGTQINTKNLEQRLYRPNHVDQRRLMMNTVWVSPCDEYSGPVNRANMDEVKRVALAFGYRISLQTHKILGVE